jgi:hypothetical protein
MGTTWDIYFLESEGITKMTFSHFKHISSVLINLVLFLKEFSGDCRVTTGRLSKPSKYNSDLTITNKINL